MGWNLIAQERALAALKAALVSGRLPHAFLFAGPEGVGKQTAAWQLAQALNCTAEASQRPCGQCSQCQRVAGRVHADIQLLTIEGREERRPDGRAAARVKNISIAQVREVEQAIALKPYEGRYRVIIIDPADAMNAEAQNAFLKTLEEPPPEVVLILISTREHALLPTIRSRCQPIEFRLAPRLEIEAALQERGGEAEQAALCSRLAEGRIGTALALAADPKLWEARSEALAVASGLARQPVRERFLLAERLAARFSSDSAAVRETLASWRSWWRDVLLLQSGCPEGVTNTDQWPLLQADAENSFPAEVVAFLRALEQTARYLEYNVNPRLALEALLLQAPRAANLSQVLS
ncbi:MAG TPA: DNA polymerase III subunit delta' [Dehalococcoidia bacterium]|nr:DNA polymerase III subunit delta' [Dehalococcoidia bacterium]